MKTYRVYAIHKEYVYADVIAESEEDARKKIDFEDHDCVSLIQETWTHVNVKRWRTKAMNENKIKYAYAVYTGGGIWLFYGQLENGNYFLTDDYGTTQILDTDPSDFDESLYEDWQQEHLIKDLEDNERIDFGNQLLDWLETADSEYRGGIEEREIDYYREYFKEER